MQKKTTTTTYHGQRSAPGKAKQFVAVPFFVFICYQLFLFWYHEMVQNGKKKNFFPQTIEVEKEASADGFSCLGTGHWENRLATGLI